MRKLTISVLVATLALVAVPALAGTATAAPRANAFLGDNFFKPVRKVVRRGTVVRFFWAGRNVHNVTMVRGPSRRFRSQTTRRRGLNFAKRFRRPGVYLLICTIHPREMRLKLGVTRR